jgi:hypothetical protein
LRGLGASLITRAPGSARFDDPYRLHGRLAYGHHHLPGTATEERDTEGGEDTELLTVGTVRVGHKAKLALEPI